MIFMALIRSAKLNVDLIKNLPSEMRNELIVFEGVIPDGIMNSLCVNDSFYNKKRMDFLNHRPDLLKKMYIERGKKERIEDFDEWVNYEVDEKVQFVKDYPQFKQLIESIIFRDGNRNVVKVVPIDQYLAEN